MNLAELTAQLTSTAGLNPDVLALLMKMSKIQEKNDKEKEKEAKKNEKKKEQEKKEKERYKPIKRCIRHIKHLRNIEELLDMSNACEDNAEIAFWQQWLMCGLQPYSSFSTRKELLNMFKENAINFIKVILKRKQMSRIGFVSTNTKRGFRKFLLKTEHGVISGRQAREYMKYLLGKTIHEIGHIIKMKYDKVNQRYEEGRTVENESKSESMEVMLATVAFNTMRCEENITDMIEYLIDEQYDEDFVQNYQKANYHSDFRSLITKLPFAVKMKMYGGSTDKANQLCGDSTSEDDYSSESDNESDSDSDSD